MADLSIDQLDALIAMLRPELAIPPLQWSRTEWLKPEDVAPWL